MVYSIAFKSIALDYYRALFRMRAVELAISSKYPEGEMRCPVHLSVGQEAISAAFALLVNVQDFAVSGHRGHTHYLGKGGNLKAMIAELYGRETGCSKGRGGSMHLADSKVNFMGTSAIVGNSIPIGVGLALSQQLQGSNAKTFVFLGDAAIEEGVFYESANFAAVMKLPVVFVCENNGFSVYSNFEYRQPKNRDIIDLAQSIGLEVFKANGMDPVDTFEVLKEAVTSVGVDSRPCFVEVSNHRFLEHCGPGDDTHLGYRDNTILEKALANDPLLKLKEILNQMGTPTSVLIDLEDEINREISDAFEFAESSPLSRPSGLKPEDEIYA